MRFSRTFKIVAGIHLGLVVVVCFHSGIVHLFEPQPAVITPVEFVVDVTPPMPDVEEVLPDVPAPTSEPEPESIPEPESMPEPKPKPKPKPRKKIEVSRKRVTRSNQPQPKPRNRLSKAEIEKLLAEGAQPSDHTSIPDESARCLALIKQTLYAVWEQPSREAATGAEAVLRLHLGPSGRVSDGALQRRSGNATLDASVMRVAESVQRIHGLSGAFIRRHPTVTVAFTVE